MTKKERLRLRNSPGWEAWSAASRKAKQSSEPPAEMVAKADALGARLIPLSQGKFTMVDAGDFDMLSKFNWFLDRKGYARRWGFHLGKRVERFMHRIIAGTPKGMQTDHINRDGLDNRRCNLRVCNHALNNSNSSGRRSEVGTKGVSKGRGKTGFYARITVNRRSIHLGTFSTVKAASDAYYEAAKIVAGEFANR